MEGAGPNQSFSAWLASLGPGDEVGVGTPFGWFHPGRSAGEVWFATGTGVSPFVAALRSSLPVRPLALFVGVRGPDEAVMRPWIEERAPTRWAFSRSGEPGETFRRVTEFAEEVPVGPGIRYFLCGNPRMIREVKALLKIRGIDPFQIHEELFFQ
jgi:ferredoxin-NADP reductase